MVLIWMDARLSYQIWLLHEEEDSNISTGSLITWYKPNCDEIFSIALPSFVVMSFIHQLLDFALRPPRNSTKKNYFPQPTQDLAQGFL